MGIVTTPFLSENKSVSYIITDIKAKESIIIDPVLDVASDTVNHYLDHIDRLGTTLTVAVETHTHADHLSASFVLHEKLAVPIVMSHKSKTQRKTREVRDGDVLAAGSIALQVLETPGHTDDCISLFGHGMVFTGDTLLFDATGRTDFQSGSSESLYNSIWSKLLTLPDDTIMYPGHDYKGIVCTTIGYERTHSERLQLDKESFINRMDNHHPPKPDMFDQAITENTK